MATFRGEYEFTGDLVLPDDAPTAQLTTASGYTIGLVNGELDSEGNVSCIRAVVIGHADDLSTAGNALRSELAAQLDLLAFTTKSRFKITAATRVIEWIEGQKTRRMDYFHQFDRRYPPTPELAKEYLDTLRELDQAKLPGYLRRALRYFRMGMFAELPEDQFMHFWLALEIVAENTKPTELIAVHCANQVCKQPLTCSGCGAAAERRPMAITQIRHLIESHCTDNGKEIAKILIESRHGLMHGSSTESIEAKHKRPFPEIVHNLGHFVWAVIFDTIPLAPDGPQLAFGSHEDSLSNLRMQVVAHMTFDYDGDQAHPPEEAIPSVSITQQKA